MMYNIRIFILTLLFCSSLYLSAQVRTTNSNGTWNTTNTTLWGGQSVPNGNTFNVNINHNVNVNSGTNYTYNTLTINANGVINRPDNAGPTNMTGTLILNGGQVISTGAGAGFNFIGQIVINSGTFNVTNYQNGITGNVTVNGGTFINNGNITGNVLVNGGTFINNGTVTGVITQNREITTNISLNSNDNIRGNLTIPANITVTTNGFRFTSIDTLFL